MLQPSTQELAVHINKLVQVQQVMARLARAGETRSHVCWGCSDCFVFLTGRNSVQLSALLALLAVGFLLHSCKHYQTRQDSAAQQLTPNQLTFCKFQHKYCCSHCSMKGKIYCIVIVCIHSSLYRDIWKTGFVSVYHCFIKLGGKYEERKEKQVNV